MGKPYSQDLRERVMATVDGGKAVGATAAVFRVSVSYIYKALIRRRTTGETSARPAGRGPAPKLAGHVDGLRERIRGAPDATLEELRAWLRSERGVAVSIGCLWGTLRSIGITLKKSRSTRPSRTARTLRRHEPRGAPARAS